MFKMVGHDRVKYSNRICGERARQRRDREREGERGRVSLKMRDGVGNKIGH